MWDFERPEILFFFFKITCSKKVMLRKRGFLWTLGGMLHAVQASILTGQAFGPRLVVMSWQLERKLLTASGVLQAFQLQQLSRISRFQGMFLDEHLYLLLCFIVSYAFFQADSPTASLSRASATKPSTLTGWVFENWKLRLQIWKISAKVWCMPCGTKAVDGWIHLLWGLWGPPSGDQTWSNVLGPYVVPVVFSCSIEWCCSLFIAFCDRSAEQVSRFHSSSFSSSSAVSLPPCFARKM